MAGGCQREWAPGASAGTGHSALAMHLPALADMSPGKQKGIPGPRGAPSSRSDPQPSPRTRSRSGPLLETLTGSHRQEQVTGSPGAEHW